MGKGRDKRKKHEDPTKALKRAEKQQNKNKKSEKRADAKEDGATGFGGLNGEEDVAVTVQRLRKAQEKRKDVAEISLTQPPSPRVNGTVVAHPSRDELLIFGGEYWDGVNTTAFNDLFIFNTLRKTWKQIKSPFTPCPRSSCQGFVYKNCLFIHGGEFVSQSQSQFLHFKDMWRMNLDSCVWEEVTAGKGGPSSRSGHRLSLWKRNAVLFGGFYDNNLESRFFNDLWVCTELDSVGTWKQIITPHHSEQPHQRSGHAQAVHGDTLFVFGGYFTHKANRFTKAESTVLHDLWMMNLCEGEAKIWQKVKLGGIPPSIRSGMGFAVKDKRLFLFGGVVDVDGPGGKTHSSFCNDLFVFNMEVKKFFPLVLSAPPTSAKSAVAKPEATLEDEIQAILGQRVGEVAQEDSESDNASDSSPSAKFSHVQLPSGQTLPCRRMNAMLCCHGHHLYILSGQYEVGKREVTLGDVFALNLNRMDTYAPLVQQDLRQVTWFGHDSEEDSNGSWEDGSTVVDADEMARLQEEEEENASETESAQSNDCQESIEDEAPALVAANATTVDGLTRKGKVGRRYHKEQLQSQLSATSTVPTPLRTESVKEFFLRTQSFWIDSARDAADGDDSDPSVLQRTAFEFAKLRFEEAMELIEQLETIERLQKAEDEVMRKYLEARMVANEDEE